ncbi:hypothetical protein F5Y10DRAFT_267838 [Nemania abortiva]|nr:hypothetical protein F5Y10DRAFT_267838 [Nemania abortiva]
MELKFDRLKDKWQALKARASPAVFRYAGHAFLAVVIIALASVIIGWIGMSKETVSHEHASSTSITMTPVPATVPTVYHETVTIEITTTTSVLATVPTANHETVTIELPTMTSVPAAAPTGYHHQSPRPTHTPSHHRLHSRDHGDPMQTTTTSTTSVEDHGKITSVRTIILTVTSVATDTELEMKTVTTTVFMPACTDSAASTDTADSPASTADGSMTVPTYCPFTGRPNIYTLCGYVYADSPDMSTSVPDVVSSSATPRMKNPFSMIRLAVASLWNSMPGLGALAQAQEDSSRRDCDCAAMQTKLDATVDLVRLQQQLLDSQRAMINQHRKNLLLALEALANVTAAARAVGNVPKRGRPLDLKI